MLDETGLLTCVEVKTRRSQKFGPAEYSVGRKKMKALSETMNAFLYAGPQRNGSVSIWSLGGAFPSAPRAEPGTMAGASRPSRL